MKFNFLKFIKLIFLSLLFLISFYNSILADIIKKIEVRGNDRLTNETIILFSELNVNENINSEDLNLALKRLFETNYFKDVKISINNANLIIKVVENPLIQSIKIEGIKNKSILKDLSKITKKIEKYPYLESQVNDQR